MSLRALRKLQGRGEVMTFPIEENDETDDEIEDNADKHPLTQNIFSMVSTYV